MDYDLLTCACTQVVNESSAMLRLDQHFSAKTTGFMRFSYDRSVDTQPLSASATDLQQKVSTPVNGALELLHVFNSRLVNEVKAGFNRSTSNQYNYSDSGIIYQIAISTGPGPGFVTENYNYASIYVGNSFSGVDDLTWVHGRQTFKAGAEIRYIQMNQEYGQHGKITFSSVENLANNVVKKASLTGALPVNGLRKNDYFVYAQDEYKWRQNLTLNLGLRYTIFDLFDEKNGKANPFDFDTCGAQGFCGVGASFGHQNYGDVDPRVAFAWTPRKDGRTVIRGGFGIYHEDGQLDDQNLPAKNEVPSYSATGSSKSPLSYPVTFGAGTISPNAEQRDRKDSYVEQWSFSAQRELPADFVGTVSYLGSHGVHLLETNVVNLIDPATRDCAISGLCSRHRLARLSRHELVQRSLRGDAAFVLPRPAGDGQLHVVARDRQRLQRQRRWRRGGSAESVVPSLRSRQRRLGRPSCGQWQCGLSAPLRHGQANAEPARDCERHCGQLGADHDGAGSHRLPGECADAQQLHRAGWGLRHRSVPTWFPASR